MSYNYVAILYINYLLQQNKAQTRIEQEGSGPITGSFNVLWNGNAISTFDISVQEVIEQT